MAAFFLVSLMGILGLAVDLGFAFAARRAVQGAADAGAIAGARQIARYTAAAPTSAQSEVNAVVAANAWAGITPTVTVCEYIGNNWGVVGTCGSTVPSSAAGSRVKTRANFPTFFIQVVPGAPDNVTVVGYAKARVQEAGVSGGGAPFIVCGSHSWGVLDKNGSAYGNPGQDVPIWSGGKISAAAVGVTFRVHDPQLNQTSGIKLAAGCKAKAANFNGLNDQDANGGKTVDRWFMYKEGTVAGPTREKVNGAQGCAANAPEPYNCVMLLPIAVDSPAEDASHAKQVYVVGWAAFYVTTVGANTHNAKLLDDYVVSGPGSDTWCRDCGGAVVIRLIW